MKALRRSLALAALLVACAAPVAAQCLPSKPADVRIGVTYKADGSAAGAWAYWWCVSGTKVTYEWRAAPVTSFSPTVMNKLRAYAMGTNPSFAGSALTLKEDDPVLAPMRADITAAVGEGCGQAEAGNEVGDHPP